MRAAILGIFVGGRGRRMGGMSKALLASPQDPAQTLAGHLIALGRALELEVVLLGSPPLAAHFPGVPQLPDASLAEGPLAGLGSLLAHTGERNAIAVACDLPYLTRGLLERLSNERPEATLLAARDLATGKWQPLCARYHGSLHALVEHALREGDRSFQAFFKRTAVTEWLLDPEERAQLSDWDTPEDVRRTQP